MFGSRVFGYCNLSAWSNQKVTHKTGGAAKVGDLMQLLKWRPLFGACFIQEYVKSDGAQKRQIVFPISSPILSKVRNVYVFNGLQTKMWVKVPENWIWKQKHWANALIGEIVCCPKFDVTEPWLFILRWEEWHQISALRHLVM